MNIRDYLDEKRVLFTLEGNNKEEIITNLSKLFYNSPDILDIDKEKDLTKDLLSREQISSTGMQDGIAIPHVKASYIKKVAVALAISKEGKQFDSIDGTLSTLFFVIIAPTNENRTFMKLLSKIASLSTEDSCVEHLLSLTNANEVINYLSEIGNEDE